MLLLDLATPLLLLTVSVAAHKPRTRNKTPWGADTLSSLYARTTTTTPTTSSTKPPPTISYPPPTTPLDNRKYKRTIAESRTVETPTTPASSPPLPPIRTSAPPAIEYGKGQKPLIARPKPEPEVAPKIDIKRPKAEMPPAQPAASTPTTQPETTITVYRKTRPASKSPAPQTKPPEDWWSAMSKRIPCWFPGARNCDSSVRSAPTTSTATANLPREPGSPRALGKEKPVLDSTLCKPCLDVMRRCMLQRAMAGEVINSAMYRKCMRQLCFFDEAWPARCRAGGRCGDMFSCPQSELLLSDWDERGFYR
ncbi:hypothetical protein PMIN03_000045 [Paraphaeosphaeria minitans]